MAEKQGQSAASKTLLQEQKPQQQLHEELRPQPEPVKVASSGYYYPRCWCNYAQRRAPIEAWRTSCPDCGFLLS